LPKLRINSGRDTQILLIGSDLQVIQRSIGSLEADVPTGFYKIKLERGGGTLEQLIELKNDENRSLTVDKFPAIAPLQPLLGNDWVLIENMCRALMPPFPPALMGVKPPPGPPPPGVLVLAHCGLEDGPGADPLAGLRVTRWDSNLPVGTAAPPGPPIRAAGELWQALWLPLEPGCYLLEITDASQCVLQSVLVAPCWQTRVFVRRQKWRSRADAPNEEHHRREWIDVSIQMAAGGAQVPYSDHYETVEVARNALELRRPIFVSDGLIGEMLYGKFDNPIAGLTGLHLFLEALERSKAPASEVDPSRELKIDAYSAGRADAIVEEAIGNLHKLLCDDEGQHPEPSDLIALRLRGGLMHTPTPVVDPPMLWASWDWLRRHGGPEKFIEIDADLWRRIAWGTAWGPYLAWPPQRATYRDFVDSQLGSRRERANAGSGVQLLEGNDLARALHIPPSVIE
jgi:hypothetical protein